MERLQTQTLLQDAAAGKLRSSVCQQVMAVEYDRAGRAVYRCAPMCGKHFADAAQVRSGLLWHFRGRSVGQLYGLPDEEIVEAMFAALQLAWVRDGDIYTVRFR